MQHSLRRIVRQVLSCDWLVALLPSPKSSVIFALIITALWVIHHGTLPQKSHPIKQNRRAIQLFRLTHAVFSWLQSYVPDILTPVTSYCFGAIVAYFWRQIYSELASYLSTFGAKTISGHSTLHLTTQYAFGKSTYITPP